MPSKKNKGQKKPKNKTELDRPNRPREWIPRRGNEIPIPPRNTGVSNKRPQAKSKKWDFKVQNKAHGPNKQFNPNKTHTPNKHFSSNKAHAQKKHFSSNKAHIQNKNFRPNKDHSQNTHFRFSKVYTPDATPPRAGSEWKYRHEFQEQLESLHHGHDRETTSDAQYTSTSVIDLVNQPFQGAGMLNPLERAYAALPQASMRIAPTRIYLTDCGSVSAPMKAVDSLGDKAPATLFQLESDAYEMNDVVSRLSKSPKHQRLKRYFESKRCDTPEIQQTSEAMDVINGDSFLSDPEKHRMALMEITNQLKTKSNALMYRFRNRALRPFIRSLLYDHAGAEEKLRATVDALHRVEECETLGADNSRRMPLSTRLMAKESLAMFEELEKLVTWAKNSSSAKEDNFNNFVLEQLHTLLQDEPIPSEQRACAADGLLLLRWARDDPVGDMVMKKHIDAIGNEKVVPVKELREHFLSQQQNLNCFREVDERDLQRERFYQIMEEKTLNVARQQFRWSFAAHAMSPYSRTFILPLVRLPENWQTYKSTAALQHCVLRSFETHRERIHRARLSKVERSIIDKGKAVIRRRGAESFLVLTNKSFSNPPAAPSTSSVWNVQKHTSIARFTEQDYLEVLSDFDESELDISSRPLRDRQSIKVSIKRFREVFRENRNTMRRTVGIPEEEPEETEPEKKKARYTISGARVGPDSLDIQIDSYREGIQQCYSVHGARAGSKNKALAAIHGKILKTAVRKNPAEFSKLLLRRVSEDSILPEAYIDDAAPAGVDDDILVEF